MPGSIRGSGFQSNRLSVSSSESDKPASNPVKLKNNKGAEIGAEISVSKGGLQKGEVAALVAYLRLNNPRYINGANNFEFRMTERNGATFLQLKERTGYDRFKGFFTQWGARPVARQQERMDATNAILNLLPKSNKFNLEQSRAVWATGTGATAREFHTAFTAPPRVDTPDAFGRLAGAGPELKRAGDGSYLAKDKVDSSYLNEILRPLSESSDDPERFTQVYGGSESIRESGDDIKKSGDDFEGKVLSVKTENLGIIKTEENIISNQSVKNARNSEGANNSKENNSIELSNKLDSQDLNNMIQLQNDRQMLQLMERLSRDNDDS